MITCTKCGESKPQEEYYKQPRNKSGYMGHCKVCERKRKADHTKKQKRANPEAWSERVRQYTASYKQRHPDRVKEQERRRNLRQMYGISVEQYEEMLVRQNGRCAICYDIPRNRRFAVDHDHSCCPGRKSCGKCIRKLLCSRCNTALGLLHEDVAIIESMLEYVK